MLNVVAMVANYISDHTDDALFRPFAQRLKLDILAIQTNEETHLTSINDCMINASRQLIKLIGAWTHVNEKPILSEVAKLCIIGLLNQHLFDYQIHMPQNDVSLLLTHFGDLAIEIIVEECVHEAASGRLSFPWKKYYLEGSLHEKFTKLQHFKPTIAMTPFEPHNIRFKSNENRSKPFYPFTFQDSWCLMISNDSDYWDMDILTDYFTEKQRMQARRRIDEKSILDRWPERALLEQIVRKAFTSKHGLCTLSLREALFQRGEECTQFKASLAFAVLDLLQAKRVLDISAGWGDRLLAVLALSTVERYVAADPNLALKEGHDAMIQTFKPLTMDRYTVFYAPFEEVPLGNEMFDTVFTSPPFFDFEIYSNLPGQSTETYFTETSWIVDFLFTSLKKCWDHLDVGGHLAIHISDVYKTRVCEPMCLYCEWKLPNCKYIGLIGSCGSVSSKVRPIWVFEKQCHSSRERAAQAGNWMEEAFPCLYRRLSFKRRRV